MPSVAAPNLHPGQILTYTLTGIVLGGDTFVEPVATQTAGPTGTLTQMPSVMGTAIADGTRFTTLVSFTAGTTLGDVTIANDVGADDDEDVTFSIVALPGPETVTVDTTSFKVSDPSPTPPAPPAAG